MSYTQITLKLNCQKASLSQTNLGVYSMPSSIASELTPLLLCEDWTQLPTLEQITQRAKQIVSIIQEKIAPLQVLLAEEDGIPPYLTQAIINSLIQEGVTPVRAYNEHVVEERLLQDGSSTKTTSKSTLGLILFPKQSSTDVLLARMKPTG